jgi:erythronate-4-phosphate dehydrogenase
MKIVADDNIPFLKGIFEPYAEIEYLAGGQMNKRSIDNASVLIVRSLTKCNESLLKDSGVRFIATATIGDDHIDKVYCRNNNIRWTNAKGCNADAVAQYVTATLLELADKHRTGLSGKTLGIIGVGNIGKRMNRIAEILGMIPLCYDPPRARQEGEEGFVSMDVLSQNSDFITLHVPLIREGRDKTLYLIDRPFFESLRRNPFLINSARGAVVETKAAKNALTEGLIREYATDVWENEPVIDRALLNRAAIATPHIAGYSVEGKFNATSMVVRAVADFMGIRPELPAKEELPPSQSLEIQCNDKSREIIIRDIYRNSCPVLMETEKLKKRPDAFLDFRKNYVLRRDNKNLRLDLEDCSDSVKQCFQDLEFTIENQKSG